MFSKLDSLAGGCEKEEFTVGQRLGKGGVGARTVTEVRSKNKTPAIQTVGEGEAPGGIWK